MKKILHRLLSPPERGTPKYRVITAAKEISDWLMLALAILLIARACGAFTPAPGGSMGNYLMLALSVVFMGRYTVGPAVWLLKQLAGYRAEDDRNV